MKFFFVYKIIISFITLFFSISAFSQSEGILNKLLAPGLLMKEHSHLEKKDCLECHDMGEGVPDSKCLVCHKEIKFMLDNKRGLHSLTKKECYECHSDHKGRMLDSTQVDKKNFEHKLLTSFDLEGKHKEIKCEECHTQKRKKKFLRPHDPDYLGATASCKSCHQKKDIHFFRSDFKKDCGQCHGLKTWKDDIKFDHNEFFKLEGKHREIKCEDCHGKKNTKIIYKWPHLKTQECLSCHKNIHGMKLTQKFRNGKCQTCHSQEKWKIEKFDHRITKYELRWKHNEIDCLKCHTQKTEILKRNKSADYNWTGLQTKCTSCHKDYHEFSQQPKQKKHLNCLNCHNESKWSMIHNFDHNQDTHYKIDGKHVDLKCNDCHVLKKKKGTTLVIYQFPNLGKKNCETCHENIHIKEFDKKTLQKKCTDCHITQSWKISPKDKAFDHSKTRFSLDGAHLKIACNDCHRKGDAKKYLFPTFEKSFCIDCHKNIHKGQLSDKFVNKSCNECHTEKNFTELLPFDHSKTNYELKGEHKEIKCEECHVQTSKLIEYEEIKNKKQEKKYARKFLFSDLKAKGCLLCHKDAHLGQLSKNCNDCHNESRWGKTHFDHSKQSDYHLLHKHEGLKCMECHKPIKDKFIEMGKNKKIQIIHYKPTDRQCQSCHKDPHKGEFGNQCQTCHSEKGWKVVRDFHKNFTLTGVHYSLECSECHKDGKKLGPIKEQCLACHLKDDPHQSTLPQCQDCHKQHFWEIPWFKHSMSSFPLRGMHRTLDCLECHQRGTYKGLNSTCISCHLSDAEQSGSFSHSPIGNFMECTQCHKNQFTFQNATP